MRFEWLFLGYILLFQLPFKEITILPFAGFSLILFAVFRLGKFEDVFNKAKIPLMISIPVATLLFGLQVYKMSIGSAPTFPHYAALYDCVRVLCELGEFASLFFIYLGIRKIGQNTEIYSLEKHATRNMSIMFVFALLETVMTIIVHAIPDVIKEYELLLFYPFLLGFIWRVLNLIMFFSCYSKVAMADPDTEEKEEEKEFSPRKPKKKRKKRKKR